MATTKEMVNYVGSLISDEKAAQLGRAALAMALMGDGHVAMVGIFNHKREVGVYGPGSPDAELDFRLMVNGNTLPLPIDIERACGKGK